MDEKIAAMGHWMALLFEMRLAKNARGILMVTRQIERTAGEINAYYERFNVEEGNADGRAALPPA